MGTPVSAFAAGQAPVWIDFYDYAARLLSRGGIPWLDQSAFAAFHARAQGLLRSGVIELPIEPVARVMVQANPAIAAEMRARSRPGYPLRTLLGHATLRETIIGLLAPLRASNPSHPLVLSIPSPGRWLGLAYEWAHGVALPAAIAPDEANNAAVYVADLLGSLAGCQIDAVLLVEDPDQVELADDWVSAYGPILNKAEHYRWEVGLLAAGISKPLPASRQIDFQIGAGFASSRSGCVVRVGEDGAPELPARAPGRFFYVTISNEAVPERLLSWLETLR